jgi:DNA-binding NarL/FixJ family response regulator
MRSCASTRTSGTGSRPAIPAPPEPARIRVLICDDALAFSTLLRHWLEADPRIEVVGSAASGAAALAMTEELHPDVVVLDHLLHDAPGGAAEMAPALRARLPGVRILVVSGMAADQLAGIAAQSGADGYVSKASDHLELRAAVRAVAA